MRITGSGNLPPNIARAYGVPGAKPVAQPFATAALGAAGHSAPVSPTSGVNPAAGARSLVAGQAPGPITFDGISVPRPTQGVFHMYTRAADKIEAATAVQIGRTLDIKG